MTFKTDIKTFAALGTGVIGSGWIARALANGLDVIAWCPAADRAPDYACAGVDAMVVNDVPGVLSTLA